MMKRTAALLGMRFAGAVTAKAYEAGEILGDPAVRNSIGVLADYLKSIPDQPNSPPV